MNLSDQPMGEDFAMPERGFTVAPDADATPYPRTPEPDPWKHARWRYAGDGAPDLRFSLWPPVSNATRFLYPPDGA